MTNQQNFISRAFIILGVLSLLLLLPMALSGGPGQDHKGMFLLGMITFGASCLICGFVLSKEKREWRWIPAVINIFNVLGLGFYIVQNFLGPDGALWLKGNNILPFVMLFLLYSEYYFIRLLKKA